MPVEQLRSLLAIGLCIVLFLMWQAWQADYGRQRAADAAQAPPAPAAPGQEGQPAPGQLVPGQPVAGQDVPQAPPAPDVPDVPAQAAPAQAPGLPAAPGTQAPQTSLVHVTTDVLEVDIDPVGGGIVRVDLLGYPFDPKAPQTPVRLLTGEGPELFVAQSGLLSSGFAPDHHTPYEAPVRSYRLGADAGSVEVRLTAAGPDGLQFTKIYRFARDSYMVDVRHRVENRGAAPWAGRMYAQFTRRHAADDRGLFRIYTYTGGVISTDAKPYEKFDFSDMQKENLDRESSGGWAAMIQHYFAGAWVPPQGGLNRYYSKALGDGRFVLGALSAPRNVPAGATEELGFTLYVGPKIQDRMAEVAPYLERTVDYGWLWFIAEPLFWLLQKIHALVKNWGWSIVVLTMIIKLAFFQLSAASYKSMARMRKLQPRMTQLRERYAGDKQRMNQAMMELYKTEKINPLGGCLPILVQIPVFIALYWVLLESVELRQAPFALWLDDLSAYDPFFVLPILMGITMFVQQRLNPAPPDPVQAKIMMALPIVFTFFFLFFPSGLVLYWFVNNLLSIVQQWVITRRIAPDT